MAGQPHKVAGGLDVFFANQQIKSRCEYFRRCFCAFPELLLCDSTGQRIAHDELLKPDNGERVGEQFADPQALQIFQGLCQHSFDRIVGPSGFGNQAGHRYAGMTTPGDACCQNLFGGAGVENL